MSAPAVPNVQVGSSSTVPPLNLPVGSVRALLTLSILGTSWAQLLRGMELSPQLRDTLILVIAYYFGTRNAKAGLVAAPADSLAGAMPDREANRKDPLFLPKGSIRALIVIGFGAVAYQLHQDGKFTSLETMPPELMLVGTFLVGAISRGGFARIAARVATKVSNAAGHALAAGTLAAVLGYCGAVVAGMESLLTPEMTATFLGITGFYLGKR